MFKVMINQLNLFKSNLNNKYFYNLLVNIICWIISYEKLKLINYFYSNNILSSRSEM